MGQRTQPISPFHKLNAEIYVDRRTPFGYGECRECRVKWLNCSIISKFTLRGLCKLSIFSGRIFFVGLPNVIF